MKTQHLPINSESELNKKDYVSTIHKFSLKLDESGIPSPERDVIYDDVVKLKVITTPYEFFTAINHLIYKLERYKETKDLDSVMNLLYTIKTRVLYRRNGNDNK